MIHKHQFVAAGECYKSVSRGLGMPGREMMGYVYVCIDPECDATRRVWSDGTKEIVKEGLPDRDGV